MHIPFCYYLAAVVIMFVLYRASKKTALSFLVSYVFLVLSQTVLSRKETATSQLQLIPYWYLTTGRKGLRIDIVRQMGANIIMFFPIGFLAARYSRKWTIPFAFFFSILIELLQYAWRRGTCETEDVISNTIGATIGLIFYLLIQIGNKWLLQGIDRYKNYKGKKSL